MNRRDRAKVNFHPVKGDPEYDVKHIPWASRLEEIGARWVTNTPENAAVWNAQISEAWECVYAACMNRRGEYTDDERSQAALYIVADLENYDPQKMELVKYVNARVTLRLRDAYSIGMDMEYDAADEDDQRGKSGLHLKGAVAASLDAPVTGAADISLGQTMCDESADMEKRTERDELYQISMTKMAARILNFQAVLHQSNKQEKQRRMEKMCFTEQTLNVAQFQTMEPDDTLKVDVLMAIYREYLDFFAHTPKELTYPALQLMTLKTWAQILGESGEDRIVEWKKSGFLEARVPVCFLKQHFDTTVSDSTVSKERDRFFTVFRELLAPIYSMEDAGQILNG